jgi:hypothetical protein
LAAQEYTVRFAEGAVSFPEIDPGRGGRFEATINDAEMDSGLETLLRALQVVSFTPIAPWFRHLDGSDYDRWGNEIELIDMTDDYSVAFAEELSPEDLAFLRTFEQITFIGKSPELEFYFTPNDPYFEDQWFLENVGQSLEFETSQSCGDTSIVADYDMDATVAWDSVLAPGCLIGLIDTGIRGSHEDLEDSWHPSSPFAGPDVTASALGIRAQVRDGVVFMEALDTIEDEAVEFELYDVLGRTVRSTRTTGRDARAQFATDGLPSGVYWVGVRSNQSVASLKVMIVR